MDRMPRLPITSPPPPFKTIVLAKLTGGTNRWTATGCDALTPDEVEAASDYLREQARQMRLSNA